jgi:REP element-mobilizing transposase RayT
MTAVSWNLDPPPGFRGLQEDRPLTKLSRHLPHWRQPGATYFVTLRLNDSLPKNKLREIEAFRTQWERQNPPPRSSELMDELWRELFRRIDRWLDQGYGSCRLRDPAAGQMVVDALHHFDGERYELGCYTVMSNHVHLVVRPLDEDDQALERVTHSWKRFTARQINGLFGLKRALWQDESYDRIVRDEEHLWRTIQYIGRNPLTAGFTRVVCPTWIRPDWERLGWRFLE